MKMKLCRGFLAKWRPSSSTSCRGERRSGGRRFGGGAGARRPGLAADGVEEDVPRLELPRAVDLIAVGGARRRREAGELGLPWGTGLGGHELNSRSSGDGGGRGKAHELCEDAANPAELKLGHGDGSVVVVHGVVELAMVVMAGGMVSGAKEAAKAFQLLGKMELMAGRMRGLCCPGWRRPDAAVGWSSSSARPWRRCPERGRARGYRWTAAVLE